MTEKKKVKRKKPKDFVTQETIYLKQLVEGDVLRMGYGKRWTTVREIINRSSVGASVQLDDGRVVAIKATEPLVVRRTLAPPAPVTLADPKRFWEIAHMVGGFWLGELEDACQSPLVLRAVLYAMERAVNRMHPLTRTEFARACVQLKLLEDQGVELSIERAPEG